MKKNVKNHGSYSMVFRFKGDIINYINKAKHANEEKIVVSGVLVVQDYTLFVPAGLQLYTLHLLLFFNPVMD